jgi:NADPH:quinone reductase-like Zn-dependent oxidoreductase
MKAIVQDTYGSPDVLKLADINKPEPGDDEVLVRVHAAGVDRGVWHLMTGLPYLTRLAFGLRAPKNPVPGMDVAGVVEAVGRDVTRFRPGDEVFGIGKGTFAEYALAREGKLAPKPANLTFEEAASVAISGLTALQGLRDYGRVEPGQKVLVIGASGGVGTFAVQIAKAFGAHVTGVCSTTKVEMVRYIGADHVIDYTREDVADGSRRWDVILDIGGSSSLSYLRRALTPQGTLVLVGGEEGGRWLGVVARLCRARLLSLFVGQNLRTFLSSENHEDMAALAELIEAGKVAPVVEKVFPLAQAPDAIRHLEEGRARGKVVVAGYGIRRLRRSLNGQSRAVGVDKRGRGALAASCTRGLSPGGGEGAAGAARLGRDPRAGGDGRAVRRDVVTVWRRGASSSVKAGSGGRESPVSLCDRGAVAGSQSQSRTVSTGASEGLRAPGPTPRFAGRGRV